MKSRLVFISIVIAFVCLMQLPWRWSGPVNVAFAEDAATPAAPATLVNGLTLSFQTATGETVDARDTRLIALLVPAGRPVSPRLAPGPFTAVWTGILRTKINDTYRFAAEGSGDLTVRLNEQPALELHGELNNHPSAEIRLKKGKNRLVVTYHSPADGDAKLRLLWAPSGALLEPMNPSILFHDPADALLVKHQAVRVGREMLASLRCTACHQGVEGSMTELKQDAPNLSDLKNRLNRNWVAYWITNPKALRPTASMPAVFHDAPPATAPTIDRRAADIAAYLTTSAPTSSTTDADLQARGARLFTSLGCVACHVAPGLDDSDTTLNRVPLKYLKAKFRPEALRDFLHKPEAHYAWIKMPNFHLSDGETSALAAWLLASCRDDALPPVTATFDADNGKKLFETSGCMSCHTVDSSPPVAATAINLAKADFARGCVADDPAQIHKGVDFGFTADQRNAIRAFMAIDWKSALQRDPPAEFATRQMSALRCNACHSMDAADSIWSNMDQDIGAIEQNLPPRPDNDPGPKGDQSRPALTWTGEKLRPGWMTSFISGEIAYKPRPWLFARMPSFASRAELLSKGVAESHGCSAVDETRPPADASLSEIGKQLTSQAVLGCVKCHAVGEQAALAPFEAEAPNFAYVEARLRHDYFSRWMRNPEYFIHGTKMPAFANGDGKTARLDILNGDADAEFEAIWNYLRAGEKIVPIQ